MNPTNISRVIPVAEAQHRVLFSLKSLIHVKRKDILFQQFTVLNFLHDSFYTFVSKRLVSETHNGLEIWVLKDTTRFVYHSDVLVRYCHLLPCRISDAEGFFYPMALEVADAKRNHRVQRWIGASVRARLCVIIGLFKRMTQVGGLGDYPCISGPRIKNRFKFLRRRAHLDVTHIRHIVII